MTFDFDRARRATAKALDKLVGPERITHAPHDLNNPGLTACGLDVETPGLLFHDPLYATCPECHRVWFEGIK